jgi:hypothetical protein
MLPLYAIHVLLPICLDGFFIDKVADLVETGIVRADFGHNFRQHLHKQAFLFVLIKIKDSGSYLIKSHSYSPFKFLNPPGCGTPTTANRFWSGDK